MERLGVIEGFGLCMHLRLTPSALLDIHVNSEFLRSSGSSRPERLSATSLSRSHRSFVVWFRYHGCLRWVSRLFRFGEGVNTTTRVWGHRLNGCVVCVSGCVFIGSATRRFFRSSAGCRTTLCKASYRNSFSIHCVDREECPEKSLATPW